MSDPYTSPLSAQLARVFLGREPTRGLAMEHRALGGHRLLAGPQRLARSGWDQEQTACQMPGTGMDAGCGRDNRRVRGSIVPNSSKGFQISGIRPASGVARPSDHTLVFTRVSPLPRLIAALSWPKETNTKFVILGAQSSVARHLPGTGMIMGREDMNHERVLQSNLSSVEVPGAPEATGWLLQHKCQSGCSCLPAGLVIALKHVNLTTPRPDVQPLPRSALDAPELSEAWS
jgi:hypothetical protein